MRVAFLYNFTENKDLFKSDKAVVNALQSLGHDVSLVFLKSIRDAEKKILKVAPDIVFNSCELNHERIGEAEVTKMLEKNNLAYTGNSGETIEFCSDKAKAKQALITKNVRTPAFQVLRQGKTSLKYPLIVKPNGQDASNGISDDSVVFDEESLAEKVSEVNELYLQPAIVEEYVHGREFVMLMLNNKILPAIEVEYRDWPEKTPKLLSYNAKWEKNTKFYKKTFAVIANINDELQGKLKKTAGKAFKAAGCRGYASMDIRLTPAGELYVIDVNPNCNLEPKADIVKAAGVLGIDFKGVVAAILENATRQN